MNEVKSEKGILLNVKKPVNFFYMNLTSYSSCEKILDFQPDKPWPKSWPAFAWENILISNFTQASKFVLNFTSKDVKFLHLFHSCYSRLSFSELGRILLKWEKREKPIFSWEEFFSLYGFSQNTDFLMQQLKIFISTPVSFQDWVNTKGVHLAELRMLSSLKKTNQVHFIFRWITEQNLSHSIGVKALELGVELLLMDFHPEEILKLNISPEETIKAMEQKRKPLTAFQDQMKQRNLKKIIWPSHVTTQWHRKGDDTGLEIKLWCRNQTELEEKINRIHQMAIFNQLAGDSKD